MNAVSTLLSSTIGKKVLMAVTGIGMFLWLAIHTTGNMIVFSGEEAFNHYAHFIQSGFGVEPALLWLLRLVMLGMIGGHIWAAIGLSARNRAARSTAYQAPTNHRATSYAARFMLIGGIVVLLFLVFHLFHLTIGMEAGFDKTQAYHNLVTGLSNPAAAGFYILANVALAAHLRHGAVSGLQTLGLNHPRYEAYKQGLGVVLPLYIAGGNIVIALAILLGLVSA